MGIVTVVFGSGEDLEVWQMTARAVVVYPLTLMIVRIGDKRFLGEMAAFDFLLAIIIGSVVSRAITGNAPFWPTMLAALALVFLHRGFAVVGFRWDRFAGLIKGRARVLVHNGEIQWDEMRKAAIGEEDLRGSLRRRGGTEDLKRVRLACLERNGEISVITT